VNNLADAAGGVWPETIGLEEVHRSTRLRSLRILEELASETGREQYGSPHPHPPNPHACGSRYSCRKTTSEKPALT
jgi:hypothetical protein